MASSSTTPLVVCTRKLPITLLQEAEQRGEIRLRCWDKADQPVERAWLLENVKGASAVLIMMSDKVDEELMEAAGPQLRCISTMSVGYDHVDLDVLRAHDVKLGHTPGVLRAAVADLVLLLILGTTRLISHATRVVREGQWPTTPWHPLAFAGPSIEGKVIGFVGFGDIAQATLLRLTAMQPSKCLYAVSKPAPFDLASPRFATLKEGGFEALSTAGRSDGSKLQCENADLERIARESDVVVVLASLNASTKHLINADFLSKMKRTAHLVNAARGPLVDTKALVEALKADQLAGVGLDVLENEPNVPASHPLLDKTLADRVLVLPHIGSATTETRRAMAELAARNALAGAKGEELIKQVTI